MTNAETSPSASTDIAANLAEVRKAIADAAKGVGRDPASVTLIAVGKVQPVEKLEAALAAGQRVFGENRVQEASPSSRFSGNAIPISSFT